MTQTHTQPDLPALLDDMPSRRRRARWIVLACAALLLAWSLLDPLLVNRIVPTLAGPQQTLSVAIVLRDDRPWLALPRPDGSTVLYTFAPQADPLPPFSAIRAFFTGTPGALHKIEFNSELPLRENVRLVSAEQVLFFDAAQGGVYGLVNRLDDDFADNIATIKNTATPGARSVDTNTLYTPLRGNTNGWLAKRIEEMGLNVKGAHMTDQWEYRPDLQ